VQKLHGTDQVFHQREAEKLQVGNGQLLSLREAQKLQVGSAPVLPRGVQKVMAGNEQVHLQRAPENLQVCIGQVVRDQRLIRHLVPAKTVNRQVTKRRHQLGGTLWKSQRDREMATRVLSGKRL
jgi:hypothetical protein